MVQVIVICSFCVLVVWIICESSYKNHNESLLQAIDIIHQRINDLGKRLKDIWKVICQMEEHIEELDDKVNKKGDE